MIVERLDTILKPDASRVLFRDFQFGQVERYPRIIARIMGLTEAEVETEWQLVEREFYGRHPRLQEFFLRRYCRVKQYMLTDAPISKLRQLLIGAYFTQEYSLESAALFNPSMIWHPEQGNLPAGARRFIISLRAIGEGHLSSITFRSGIIHDDHRLEIDKASRFVTAPERLPNPDYDKSLFQRKLFEMNVDDEFSDQVLKELSDSFTYRELNATLERLLRMDRAHQKRFAESIRSIRLLADSNYQTVYDSSEDISERIVFPTSPSELNGIEDARFVHFADDNCYYATYTAYDGKVILPQLLMTRDFLRFHISTLNGPQAQNKGMALFPRRINGLYTMISRQDGENIYLMYSDNIHFWYEREMLLRPTYPWEFVQLGNCGSPIELDEGWLVLTHGVGPVRRYCMGAFLLDHKDPSKVKARLREPLLSPNENERKGYVPNVVYSCGGVVHNGKLVIPYAMADYASSFALVPIGELLDAMEPVE